MNVNARNAYARAQADGLTGRALEAAVLDRCAHEMTGLMQKDSVSTQEFQASLGRNRELWSLFVAGVSEPGCPLPDDLKINIGQLAIFVEAQMRKAFATQDAQALEPIIFINRQLAAGLRGKPGAELPPLP